MNFMDAIDPLYAISGFGIGVLVGMTGVGGGSLMTPLLSLMLGAAQRACGCARIVHDEPRSGSAPARDSAAIA